MTQAVGSVLSAAYAIHDGLAHTTAYFEKLLGDESMDAARRRGRLKPTDRWRILERLANTLLPCLADLLPKPLDHRLILSARGSKNIAHRRNPCIIPAKIRPPLETRE
jgi:hypothetical protein